MNLNTIYLQGHTESFTPEEIAGVLEHGVLNRHQLLTVVAARVAGFDYVAAGALLNGVEGHPQALARVVELFEQTQPEQFDSLVDEVVSAIGERGIRSAWKRMKQSNSVAARDVLMDIHTKIEAMAAKPFPEHRKERAEKRFEKLKEDKRKRSGNQIPFEGYSVTSR
jgi:hypothetical protein